MKVSYKNLALRFLGVLFLLLLLVEYIPLADRVIVGRQLAQQAQPFSVYNEDSALKVLVIGDSSAVGTGASRPEDSIAGRLSSDYRKATIANLAINGAVTAEVSQQLDSIGGVYDLLIINTGANDILRFTPLDKFKEELDDLLATARTRAEVVVLFTTGNASQSPFLPRSLARIYGQRSVDLRDIALTTAQESGALYVDIIGHEKSSEDDPYARDFFSTDGLHPSSNGYKTLYEWMLKTFEKNNILLDDG